MLKKNETDGSIAAVRRSHVETDTIATTFSAYASSSAEISKVSVTQDGLSCTTYDIALNFLDQVPLDGEHGKSCLLRLSEQEIKSLITLLNYAIS